METFDLDDPQHADHDGHGRDRLAPPDRAGRLDARVGGEGVGPPLLHGVALLAAPRCSGPELALEPLGGLLQRAGVGTGRQVLPAAVADDEHHVGPLAGLQRPCRPSPARRAGSRRWRCRRRCPPARSGPGSGAARRRRSPRTARSAPSRRTAPGRSPRRCCAGRRPARRSAARRRRSGCPGTFSRRNRPAPISVPVVPSPATKWVIVGRSAQDLRPGAARSAPAALAGLPYW